VLFETLLLLIDSDATEDTSAVIYLIAMLVFLEFHTVLSSVA
jgi:hypothetical protein